VRVCAQAFIKPQEALCTSLKGHNVACMFVSFVVVCVCVCIHRLSFQPCTWLPCWSETKTGVANVQKLRSRVASFLRLFAPFRAHLYPCLPTHQFTVKVLKGTLWHPATSAHYIKCSMLHYIIRSLLRDLFCLAQLSHVLLDVFMLQVAVKVLKGTGAVALSNFCPLYITLHAPLYYTLFVLDSSTLQVAVKVLKETGTVALSNSVHTLNA